MVHVTGPTDTVVYKEQTHSSQYPDPDTQDTSDRGIKIGDGNNGISSIQDARGSVTIQEDGYYILEAYGGDGAAAGLHCEGERSGYGGQGGYVSVRVYLRVGDVVSYTVAAGGIKPTYQKSSSYTEYGGNPGHLSIGADGRNTTVSINGQTAIIAYGGQGGYRGCVQNWTLRDTIRGLFPEKTYASNVDGWDTDDPAMGGPGGSTYVAPDMGLTIISQEKGANGKVYGMNQHEVAEPSGLSLQSWFAIVNNIGTTTTPGLFLMSLDHDHQFVSMTSTCTEKGTADLLCELCGGIKYGMVEEDAHGHDFQEIPRGTPGYEAMQGSTYFLSHSNSSTNKETAQYDGDEGYYYTYQCSYCKGLADPLPAFILYFDYDKPATSGALLGSSITDMKYYAPNVNKIGDRGDLPTPSIRGYIHSGWYVDGNLITGTTTWTWLSNKTATSKWQPITYSVRYNDGSGNTAMQSNLKWDTTYSVYTAIETKFTKPGYYLDGWATKPDGSTVYKVPVDAAIVPGRTSVDKFTNLTDVPNGVVDLYAVWKPAPCTIRIWDNYNGSSAPYKDYVVYYDTDFTLPEAIWSHRNAYLLGYDLNPNVLVTPTYHVHDAVKNLPLSSTTVLNIYCIWDNTPEISSPSEITFDYSTAKSFGINISNGTVSSSDLEAWLLSNAVASDYEWSKRNTGSIPIGNTKGYSLRIESFEPDIIKDSADKSVPLSYTITFAITDDVGNSATSVTKLFLGDAINILIKTY